jgi:hypothetical protein
MNEHAAAVECHSGHTYAGEPRAVFWQGQRHEVVAVVARWRLPEGPAFRVLTEAGAVLDLYYDEGQDRWEIHPWEASPVPDDEDPVGKTRGAQL